ncbi:cyclic nucleotide-binding domain-containing protein [Polaromonas sp.]|uniref:cyclic nucleotide-binding domain-containing protein n=1 Tax=Polaromonas sp. TaxID=1869339 RepID=UPI002FCC8803
MNTLEAQLQGLGLELLGSCENLSSYGPELLQVAALLEDFTPQEMDILGAAMLRVRARPGQVLIREGERGDWMLLILSGTVDVTKRIDNRDKVPGRPGNDLAPAASSRLAVLKRGTTVGEMSMLDNELRYASCVALEAVEAAVLSRSAVAELIHQHPGVSAKLLVKITQLMAQRLRNTSNLLVKLLQKP